jgi:hypothetical protein
MKPTYVALTLAVLLIVVGCAPLVVDYDYDTTYDFSRLKTYDWSPIQPGSDKEELTAKRIEHAVNGQLQSKGYARATDAPDFQVSIKGVRKTVEAGSVGVGASVAVPVGSHGSVRVGGGKSKPRTKQEGTLDIDIKDPKTAALIWQGNASVTIQEKMSAEEQQKTIDHVVAEVLKNFPPQKK